MLLQQEQRTQVTFFLADVSRLKIVTLKLNYNGKEHSFYREEEAQISFWFSIPLHPERHTHTKINHISSKLTTIKTKQKTNTSIEQNGKFLITKETISALQNQFKGGSKSFGFVDETSHLEMCSKDGQQFLDIYPFISGRKTKLFAGELLQDKEQGQGQGKGVVAKVATRQPERMVVFKEYSLLKSLARLEQNFFPKLEGWIENEKYCGIVTSPKGQPLLNTSLLLGSDKILRY